MNPTGLCLCGCGETTGVYRSNWKAKGWVKGAHRDFKNGHYMKTAEGKDLARTLIPAAQVVRHAQMEARRGRRHAKAAGAMMAKGFVNQLNSASPKREFVLFPRNPKSRGNAGSGMKGAAFAQTVDHLFPGGARYAKESADLSTARPKRPVGRPKKSNRGSGQSPETGNSNRSHDGRSPASISEEQ